MRKFLFALIALTLFAGCKPKDDPSVGLRPDKTYVVVDNRSANQAMLTLSVGSEEVLFLIIEPNTVSEAQDVSALWNNIPFNGRVRAQIRIWDNEAVTERVIFEEPVTLVRFQKNVLAIDADNSVLQPYPEDIE